VFDSEENTTVKKSNTMNITRSDVTQVQEEISRAVRQHIDNIDRDCSDQIFIYKVTRGSVIWTMRCCKVCGRPNLVHEDPWGQECTQEPIHEDLKGEYIEQMEDHRWIKQVAKMMVPDRKREREREGERRWSETKPCLKDRTPRTPVVNKNHDRFRLWYEERLRKYEEDTSEVPCREEVKFKFKGEVEYGDDEEENEYEDVYEEISEVMYKEETRYKVECEVEYENKYEDEYEDEHEDENKDVTDCEYKDPDEENISEEVKVEVECETANEEEVDKQNILRLESYVQKTIRHTLTENTNYTSLEDVLHTEDQGYAEFNQDIKTITQAEFKQIEWELDLAREKHERLINTKNYLLLITGSKKQGWSAKRCGKCQLPTLTHNNPWSTGCDRRMKWTSKPVNRLMFEAFKRVFIKDMEFLYPKSDEQRKQQQQAKLQQWLWQLSQQQQCQQQQNNHQLQQQQEQQQHWQQKQWQQQHWQPDQLQQQQKQQHDQRLRQQQEQQQHWQPDQLQQQQFQQHRSATLLTTPSLVEKQQKCQKKQQEDQQQQRSGTHQYQENRSEDSGCEIQEDPPTPRKQQAPQEETKPEENSGKTSTQSYRKPEVDNIINITSVSTPPPMPPTVAPMKHPSFMKPQEEIKPEESMRENLNQNPRKSEVNNIQVSKPKTTHGSKTRKKLEKQERVRKKKKKKAPLLKTQALLKNKIKLIHTRNNFKIRRTTILTNYRIPRWKLNPQKPEDSENLDKECKTPKVENILHKKINQEEGTKIKNNPGPTLTEDTIETQIIPTRRRFQFEGGTKVSSSGKTKVPICMEEDDNKLGSVSDRVLTDMGSLVKLKRVNTETCPEIHFFIRLILERGRPPEDWFRVFFSF